MWARRSLALVDGCYFFFLLFLFFFVIAIQVAAVAGQNTVTSSPPSAGEWKEARWQDGQVHFNFTGQQQKKKKQQQALQKHSSEVGELHTDITGATLSIKPQPQSVPSSQN